MGQIKAYKGRVIGLAILSIILPLIVLLALIIRFENAASKRMMEELDQIAVGRVSDLATDIYALCDTFHRDVKEKVERGLTVIRDRLKNDEYVTIGQTVIQWETENPYTKKPETLDLPQMMMANVWLGQSTNATRAAAPAFDDLRRLAGGHIAVFQKIDDEGNMLTVANSMTDAAGKRIIGTWLPAKDSNGAANPVIEKIVAGQSFQAMETVDNDWYMTYYEPIRGKNGTILGMLSYREKWNAMDLLKDFFASRKLGKQGEIGFIAVHGKDQGYYIVSEGHRLFGSNVWNGKDARGRSVVASLARQAMEQVPGKVVSDGYWVSAQDTMRKNIAAAVYFEGYSSLIFVRMAEGDFYSPLEQVNNLIPRFLIEVAVAGSFFLLLFVLMAAFLEKNVTAVFRFFADIAERLAKGDAKLAREILEKEWSTSVKGMKKKGVSQEMGDILDAFQTLTKRIEAPPISHHMEGRGDGTKKEPEKPEESKILTLNVLVEEEGKDSLIQSEEQQDKEAESSQGKAEAVVVNQIQSYLSQTMETVMSGRKNLEEVESDMRNLVQSTTDLSGQFHGIQDKTRLLSEDVKKMVDIAEQTSVFSFNAFLKAEKEGLSPARLSEALHDVSALSEGGEKMAHDLDGQVTDIQDTMVSSFQEQAALGTEIRKSAEKIADIREGLDKIIDQLQENGLGVPAPSQETASLSEAVSPSQETVSPSLETVSPFEETVSLSEEAVSPSETDSPSDEEKAIDEAVVRLADESTRIKDYIEQFSNAMNELTQAADQLQKNGEATENTGMVTNFKIVIHEIKQMAQGTGIAVQDVAEGVKALQGISDSLEEKGDIHNRLAHVIQVSDRLYQIIDHLQSYNFHAGDLRQMANGETPEETRILAAITGITDAAQKVKDSLHDFKKATDSLVHHFGEEDTDKDL